MKRGKELVSTEREMQTGGSYVTYQPYSLVGVTYAIRDGLRDNGAKYCTLWA